MNRLVPIALAALLAANATISAHAAATPADQQAQANPAATADAPLPTVQLQAWEKRRYEFANLTKQLRAGDAMARKDFERIVRRFEAAPFELPPLESMDILGAVFVPQAGLEKMLPVVAAQAALGLYDAYRFASKVGQAELLVSEQFLRRPLTLAGAEQAATSRKFLQERAELAARLVQQGLQLAESERLSPAYDTKWVTALDRARQFCPPESACGAPYEAPKPSEWPAIWQKVRDQVTAYYRVEPEAAAAAPAAPASAASTPAK